MSELTKENSSGFVSLSVVENTKYKVLFLNILNSNPTPLQWEDFKCKFINAINTIEKSEQKFAFLFNVKNLGIISIKKVKEFIDILKKFENCIDNQLMCTTLIIEARAVKLICGLFLTFYKTKKPLFFFKNKEMCVERINEFYNGNHTTQEGVDYNDLEQFEKN